MSVQEFNLDGGRIICFLNKNPEIEHIKISHKR